MCTHVLSDEINRFFLFCFPFFFFFRATGAAYGSFLAKG